MCSSDLDTDGYLAAAGAQHGDDDGAGLLGAEPGDGDLGRAGAAFGGDRMTASAIARLRSVRLLSPNAAMRVSPGRWRLLP